MNQIKCKSAFYGALLMLLCHSTTTIAADVTVPNSFTAGTPARAADVNANFSAVTTAINSNSQADANLKQEVEQLRTLVSTLTEQVERLQRSVDTQPSVALDKYFEILNETTIEGNDYATIRFKRANIQIVNDTGETDSTNEYGNLIIGYDMADSSGISRCTVGASTDNVPTTDASSCSSAGGQWVSTSFKAGSHNLVLGDENNYSSYGAIVAGNRSTSTSPYGSVLGGQSNTAQGYYSTVSGGGTNTANGKWASVSGGGNNSASGPASSVSGGDHNKAAGDSSSVSAGFTNTASAIYSSVSAGGQNSASYSGASVSGGYQNTASGHNSSVSGGYNNTASGSAGSVHGGLNNRALNYGSSVSGGDSNRAEADASSILGGNTVQTNSTYQTIPALP